MNGVIETTTGDLLRAGYVDFLNDGSFDASTETSRGDVPIPAMVRGDETYSNLHRWNGSAWVEVTQPVKLRPPIALIIDSPVEPVEPGALRVLSNGRPAIEMASGVTGFSAARAIWPYAIHSDAIIRATVLFVLKSRGTGTKVRIALKAKASGVGDDTSAAFGTPVFTVATVDHNRIGDLFAATVDIPVSAFGLGMAVAVQVGVDGNNKLGVGDSHDVDVAIQMVGFKIEAM